MPLPTSLPAATNGVCLSLVLPAYRVAPWLEDCVDSLLADAPAGLEIIVVDDGSPDETPAIADALAVRDQRVRVIHQANGGVSAARNAGLDAARGTWVGFIDPDDRVERGWARELLAAAGIDPAMAMVVGEVRMICGGGAARVSASWSAFSGGIRCTGRGRCMPVSAAVTS